MRSIAMLRARFDCRLSLRERIYLMSIAFRGAKDLHGHYKPRLAGERYTDRNRDVHGRLENLGHADARRRDRQLQQLFALGRDPLDKLLSA